jgi:hypothetical protein
MRFRKTEDREHLLICRAISLPRLGECLPGYRLFDNARRTRGGTKARLFGELSPLPVLRAYCGPSKAKEDCPSFQGTFAAHHQVPSTAILQRGFRTNS